MSVFDNYQCTGQMSLFDLGIWSGKTSSEHSQATTEKTSDASLKKPQKLRMKTPLFLDFRKAKSGETQDLSWATDIVSLGEYMTHNTTEYRSEEEGYVFSLTLTETPQEKYYLNCGEKPLTPIPTKLSWILETDPDPKYRLSAKACNGILTRAERRGKELPKMLRETLMRQSLSKNEPDVRVGVKEYSSNTNEREHSQPCVTNSSSNDIAGTLDASYYKGCGERQGAEREVVCVGNGQLMQAKESPLVGALNCMHDQQAIMTYATQACGDRDNSSQSFIEETAYTIPANPMSDRGQAVCYGVDCYNQTHIEEKAKTLTSGRNDKNNIPCVYGLDRASFNQGKNAKYDFAVEEEKAQPLVARGPGGGLAQSEHCVQEITKE